MIRKVGDELDPGLICYQVGLLVIRTHSDSDVAITATQKSDLLPKDEFISEIGLPSRGHDEDFFLFDTCHKSMI